MTNIKKTIVENFPTWEEFWEEARKYALHATLSSKEKVSFYFVAWQWYNYWKEVTFLGSPETAISRMLAQLGSSFVGLNKREQLYLKLFPKIEEKFNLISITSTEKGKDKIDKETKNRANKKITSSYEPIHSLTDLIEQQYGTHTAGIFPDNKFKSRADWVQTKSTIEEGMKTTEGMIPNYSKEKGTLLERDFTRTTKEQPQQQVARIIQCFTLVEYDLIGFLQSFSNFFDSWADLPEEYTLDNLVSGEIFSKRYARKKAILEQEEEKKKKKAKVSQWQDISEEEWKEIHQLNEQPHMPTWYLEYLWRSKKRLEENLVKQKSGTAEKTARTIETIDKLIETFYGEVYWSSLNNYDKVMKQIIGFKEFKQEQRNQIEVAKRRKERGQKMLQIFYILLGKPGVGKSEICQRLAKALKRPIIIINVGGMEHVKELEGTSPSYSGANYGKIVEAFVDKSVLIKYTIKDLEKEVKKIKNRGEKILTAWEKERIEKLELEIKEWKKDNEKRRRRNQPELKEKSKGIRSRAPIILFDEFEKASKQEILDKIGNITDRKLNWTFTDKFLNIRIDLSEALILLTANYLSKVPEFIRSRCKAVNIELLTYQWRIEALKIVVEEILKDYQLTHLRNLISDKFLEMCITETWGIRGGINNLVATVDFLELMEVREIVEEITDLAKHNEYWETPTEGLNGYLKRQEGIMKLTFNTSIGNQELILARQLAHEINPETGKKETAMNMVEDWPAQYWWGGYRYQEN